MGDAITWNNSALTCLEECGEKFRRKILEKEPVPRTPRQARGTAVHKAATSSLLRKMETGALPSAEEARDVAAETFDGEWLSGVRLDEEESAQGADRVRGDSKDFAVDLAAFHVTAVAPPINPVGVERKITVQPKDSDLVVHGTIDLIDAQPAGEVIRDLKTSTKSPSKDKAHKSQQLTMYGMIRAAEVGRLPASYQLDYLVRTPARQEKKHVPLETTRGPADVAALVRRINAAVEAVKRGAFVPAPPDAWQCSPRFCEFFDTCVYTAAGQRRPTS